MSRATERLQTALRNAHSSKESAEFRLKELEAEQATERELIAIAEADIADFGAALVVLGETVGG